LEHTTIKPLSGSRFMQTAFLLANEQQNLRILYQNYSDIVNIFGVSSQYHDNINTIRM
jgi:hypothetical protein